MFSKTVSNTKAIARLQEERSKANREIVVLQRASKAEPWKHYKVATSASEAMNYCDDLWDAGLQATTEEAN